MVTGYEFKADFSGEVRFLSDLGTVVTVEFPSAPPRLAEYREIGIWFDEGDQPWMPKPCAHSKPTTCTEEFDNAGSLLVSIARKSVAKAERAVVEATKEVCRLHDQREDAEAYRGLMQKRLDNARARLQRLTDKTIWEDAW